MFTDNVQFVKCMFLGNVQFVTCMVSDNVQFVTCVLSDKVQFGDVVHAPPVLSVRPKKASGPDVDRVSSVLLQSLSAPHCCTTLVRV